MKPEALAYLVAAIALVCTSVIVVTGHGSDVPPWMDAVILGAISGGAGVSVGRSSPRRRADPPGGV